jgi:hypothetical protein
MGTWVNFFIIFLVVLALIGMINWLVRWFGADRLGGGTARRRQPPRLSAASAAVAASQHAEAGAAIGPTSAAAARMRGRCSATSSLAAKIWQHRI